MLPTDPLTPAERSQRMSLIRNGDTRPEMLVRRLLHGLGYRYVLRSERLPGRPDLVFPHRRKVIFVHGCFWHQHDCGRYRMPRSNTGFWESKLQANVARDSRNLSRLREMGWDVAVVWECELKDRHQLQTRLVAFLGSG
ncbi:MAG TPA: DNA mismatch endonuclease Vsr [Phycisphaerae bacterium]|nr:DNA mismatch endonuclease Vsr [Phycisphaerae bacterium]